MNNIVWLIVTSMLVGFNIGCGLLCMVNGEIGIGLFAFGLAAIWAAGVRIGVSIIREAPK